MTDSHAQGDPQSAPHLLTHFIRSTNFIVLLVIFFVFLMYVAFGAYKDCVIDASAHRGSIITRKSIMPASMVTAQRPKAQVPARKQPPPTPQSNNVADARQFQATPSDTEQADGEQGANNAQRQGVTRTPPCILPPPQINAPSKESGAQTPIIDLRADEHNGDTTRVQEDGQKDTGAQHARRSEEVAGNHHDQGHGHAPPSDRVSQEMVTRSENASQIMLFNGVPPTQASAEGAVIGGAQIQPPSQSAVSYHSSSSSHQSSQQTAMAAAARRRRVKGFTRGAYFQPHTKQSRYTQEDAPVASSHNYQSSEYRLDEKSVALAIDHLQVTVAGAKRQSDADGAHDGGGAQSDASAPPEDNYGVRFRHILALNTEYLAACFALSTVFRFKTRAVFVLIKLLVVYFVALTLTRKFSVLNSFFLGLICSPVQALLFFPAKAYRYSGVVSVVEAAVLIACIVAYAATRQRAWEQESLNFVLMTILDVVVYDVIAAFIKLMVARELLRFDHRQREPHEQTVALSKFLCVEILTSEIKLKLHVAN